MGLFSLFKGRGNDVRELARRLGLEAPELTRIQPAYRHFVIPKRTGGKRRISAPEEGLKALQRRILKRLLGKLRAHPAARGFETGHSIVTNALVHTGKAVVIRMDLKDFFPSTGQQRVHEYFETIGWNKEAAGLLTYLTTFEGGLPQGAPTSPRLSNLVNYRLDARLSAMARRRAAGYTRYADDMTFSLARDDPEDVRTIVRLTKAVVSEYGYLLHQGRKLRIRRRHDRQLVTGLTVNQAANLPRETRRWLRAVEHRAFFGQGATISDRQLAGWTALRTMIDKQVKDH